MSTELDFKHFLDTLVEGPATECWPWGGRLHAGYGQVPSGRGAHRVAYEWFVGPIPTKLEIDHLCHNEDLACRGNLECAHRRCVNPAHLQAVTKSVNRRRAIAGRPHIFDSLRRLRVAS